LRDAIIAADPKFSAAQADSNQILWLALTLTPGLGPTRSRLGTVDRVFSASLSELEASGLPVQSAQALATGRSVEFANEQMARAAAADVHLSAFDDPTYPARLRQIYDPPPGALHTWKLSSTLASRRCRRRHPASNSLRHGDG
jgi:predicted Rossmann fold nucleotide-binding protein DprA/Smf involved in DNA uptake